MVAVTIIRISIQRSILRREFLKLFKRNFHSSCKYTLHALQTEVNDRVQRDNWVRDNTATILWELNEIDARVIKNNFPTSSVLHDKQNWISCGM